MTQRRPERTLVNLSVRARVAVARTAGSRVGALGRVAALLGFSGAAVLVGRSSAQNPTTAATVAAAPLALAALFAPHLVLGAAVALLVFPNAIPAGPGALQVSVSDVLLVLGVAGLVLASTDRDGTARARMLWRDLAPLRGPVVIYLGAAALAVTAHFSTSGVTTMVQRFELVVLAAIAGAALADRGVLRRALVAYLVAAGVMSVVTLTTTVVLGETAEEFLGVQKNPAGGAIATALLVALTLDRLALRPAWIALLGLGLLASLSRGSIIGALVGVLVLVLVRGRGTRVRDLVGLTILTAALLVAFRALPETQQNRLLDVSPETDGASEIRVGYAEDAARLIRDNPVLGVGPGNYRAGSGQFVATDPHNVYLFQAAEGGAVLLLGFAILVLGTLWILLRRVRSSQFVVMALVVQTSSLVHAGVDVYWVRNTPVLGWLLVGAALVAHARARSQTEARAASVPVQPERVPWPTTT